MKIIAFTIYVLVLIVACVVVGWWTLIPGIGIPILYLVIWHVLPEAMDLDYNIRSRNMNRNMAINIAQIDERTDETHRQAEFAADQLGIKIKKGRGHLTKPLFELSNEYLGRFLAHLLDSKYDGRVFAGVAASLLQNRPDATTAILEPIQRINPEAAMKLAPLLER